MSQSISKVDKQELPSLSVFPQQPEVNTRRDTKYYHKWDLYCRIESSFVCMKEVLGTVQDKKKSAIPLTSQPSRGGLLITVEKAVSQQTFF